MKRFLFTLAILALILAVVLQPSPVSAFNSPTEQPAPPRPKPPKHHTADERGGVIVLEFVGEVEGAGFWR